MTARLIDDAEFRRTYRKARRSLAREMRRDGASLSHIARVFGVTKPCVSGWVRDLSCHVEIRERNTAARYAEMRIYPPGYSDLAYKMRSGGFDREQTIRTVGDLARREASLAAPSPVGACTEKEDHP